MDNRLSQHLHISNAVFPEQLGFWKGIHSENAGCKLTDSVFKSLNQNRHIGGIFCYLGKALECVKQKILVAKLHFTAFKEQCKFIEILCDRKQVEIK
jgi:hypothetical protein